MKIHPCLQALHEWASTQSFALLFSGVGRCMASFINSLHRIMVITNLVWRAGESFPMPALMLGWWHCCYVWNDTMWWQVVLWQVSGGCSSYWRRLDYSLSSHGACQMCMVWCVRLCKKYLAFCLWALQVYGVFRPGAGRWAHHEAPCIMLSKIGHIQTPLDHMFQSWHSVTNPLKMYVVSGVTDFQDSKTHNL